MGSVFSVIDEDVKAFIEAQHIFFVATAPLVGDGHVNLSPKGLDTLRVLSPTSVAYLDYVGSGAETIAHLRENGRIVIMLCSFEGPSKILRLYGRGEVLEPSDPAFAELRSVFPDVPQAPRSIIRVTVTRVADSCGFGVPLYHYEGERTQMDEWCERKGAEGLDEYQRRKNVVSLDGLPALRWPAAEE